MSENLGTAVLELTTDDSKLDKGLDGAGRKSNKFFSGLGKAAKLAAVGGFVALGVAAADVVSDFLDDAKAAAQTAAVLESTGGVANVTAKHVANLATAIRDKSGIDDAAVTSGENMLLTFTKVRNEVGKGNDIFDQATMAAANVSAALGKDMPAAAMLVGKALNDPIKGMTAMGKAGIQFTQAQKDTIKALVASGDTMGAQKIILGELETQFGGSAEAAGQTFGGQLNILKGQLEDAGGVLVGKLMPYLQQFVAFLIANVPTAIAAVTSAFDFMQQKFNEGAALFREHIELFKTVGIAIGIMAAAWLAYTIVVGIATTATAILGVATAILASPLLLVIGVIALVVIALVALYRHSDEARAIMTAAFNAIKTAALSVFNALTAFWNQWGSTIVGIFTSYFNMVKSIFKAVLAVLRGDWSAAWDNLKAAAQAGWDVIVGIFRLAVGTVGAAAVAIGKAAVSKIKEGMDDLKTGVQNKLEDGWKALTDAPGKIAGKAASIGSAIVDGIVSGVGGLYGRLKSKLESDLASVLSNLNPFSPVEHGGEIYIGRPIMEGAMKGVLGAKALLAGALDASVQASVMGVSMPDITAPTPGSNVNVTQHFNETPANADPVAIGAVTSFALRNLPV